MEKYPLSGHAILVVEDEPIIAYDIADAFEAAGATVWTADTLHKAMDLAGAERLSAAVLDFGLSDGTSEALYECLGERHVPYILHTAYVHRLPYQGTGCVIPKPANPAVLVDEVLRMLPPKLNAISLSISSEPSHYFDPETLIKAQASFDKT